MAPANSKANVAANPKAKQSGAKAVAKPKAPSIVEAPNALMAMFASSPAPPPTPPTGASPPQQDARALAIKSPPPQPTTPLEHADPAAGAVEAAPVEHAEPAAVSGEAAADDAADARARPPLPR